MCVRVCVSASASASASATVCEWFCVGTRARVCACLCARNRLVDKGETGMRADQKPFIPGVHVRLRALLDSHEA